MNGSRRRVTTSATAALIALGVLTGCVKTDLTTTIGSDSKATGTLIVGVSEGNLDSLGGTDTVNALRGDVVGLSKGATVKQSNYKDADFIGVKASFSALTLDDLSSLMEAKTEALAGSGQLPADAITLKVTKTADRYRVVGVIDLRDDDDRKSNAPGSDQSGSVYGASRTRPKALRLSM